MAMQVDEPIKLSVDTKPKDPARKKAATATGRKSLLSKPRETKSQQLRKSLAPAAAANKSMSTSEYISY